MSPWHRAAFAFASLISLASTAFAEQPAPPADAPPDPLAPPPASDATPSLDTGTEGTTPAEDEQPKRGDFDAGGQVRLPSGPDEMNQYAAFNWVAVDLEGRYFLLDSVTVNGSVPLAVKKPDMLATGGDPRMIGGAAVSLEAKLPRLPFQSTLHETEVGLVLTGAYLREGAMLLSERDYPLFVGDFQPGFSAGAIAKVKLSSLLDVSTTPAFVYQSGSEEAVTAVQIPASVVVKLGSLLKVSADAGVFTGDDFSFGGDDGGRIAAGGSITVKLGPILAHAGAGVASLLTGGLYPTIGDSLYVDLDVKYVK